MDLFLLEKIAVARLEQACLRDGPAALRFRMDDGKGDVRLTEQEWESLGGWFREAVAPSARRLRLAILFTVPFGIALLAVIANVPALAAVAGRIDNVVPLLLPLLITAGLPLGAAVAHGLAVQRAFDGVKQALLSRARLGASPVPRALNALELIALVLVGPHLLVGLVGSLSPDAFRDTPWSGAQLGLLDLLGLVVLAALAWRRWQTNRHAAAWAGEGGRAVDVVARARDTAP
jgi:hypothetical protein